MASTHQAIAPATAQTPSQPLAQEGKAQLPNLLEVQVEGPFPEIGSEKNEAASDEALSNPSNGPGVLQAPPERLAKEKAHRYTKFKAAGAYTGLLAVGAMRQAAIKSIPVCLRDEAQERYATKEKFNPWLEEFFHQHMYRLGLDLFNRVIASAPDATVEVVKRIRPTPGRMRGKLLEPLYDLALTEETHLCLNLASYNYLGFGGVDQFCTPAAMDVAIRQGFSPGASRTEGGTLPIHRELELEVARFLKKEDAIVIGMGFATNSTILPALLGGFGGNCKGILVLSDQLNHKSIVEGVRLSGGTVKAFPHNDMEALETELRQATSRGQLNGTPWRKIFILVEGIYSMEGEFCRLREIVTLKNRYRAYIYLDEAHSIGAVGPTGRGVTELLGVPTSEVEVMMGTFTKSFGSAGGYIATTHDVVAALRQSAPGSVFASAMSAPCAAQALMAFRVIDGVVGATVGTDKLASIRSNSNFFRQRLIDEGFTVLGDVDSPVIPVMIYHPLKLAKFSRSCLAAGIAIVVVGFPAVPVLEGRARFCVSAAHTREQLEAAATTIAAIGREVGMLYERRGHRAALKELVGLRPRASKTLQQREDYAVWLRTAPMQRMDRGDVALEAADWTPEPLAPSVAPELLAQLGDLPSAAQAAAERPEQRSARDMRMFDPLGYGARPLPAAQEGIRDAMKVYGFGACGPRGFYGTSKLHLELEERVAQFLNTEDAIMYSAGVATASSVLPALVQPGDYLIVDAEVHLGLRTGLRLCKDAVVTWVPHGDVSALESALSLAVDATRRFSAKTAAKRIFIVAEAIYQRTGYTTQLAEVLALKERYGAYLVFDETLSFGTLGSNGRGLAEHLGLDGERIDAVIGSFEHAVAGVGGFCAGRKSIVEHQRLAGAGYCFSASCPPSACAAAIAMIADLGDERGNSRARIAGVQEKAALLHDGLRNVVASTSKVTLASSRQSYVQHLRWTGALEDGNRYLFEVARRCLATRRVRVQVCSPLLCATEVAVNARIGATLSPPAPSIRLCASAEHTADDIAVACAALTAVLAES